MNAFTKIRQQESKRWGNPRRFLRLPTHMLDQHLVNISCNQLGYQSIDCPLRKVVHLVERQEEEDNEIRCESDGDKEEEEDYEDDDGGKTMW